MFVYKIFTDGFWTSELIFDGGSKQYSNNNSSIVRWSNTQILPNYSLLHLLSVWNADLMQPTENKNEFNKYCVAVAFRCPNDDINELYSLQAPKLLPRFHFFTSVFSSTLCTFLTSDFTGISFWYYLRLV